MVLFMQHRSVWIAALAGIAGFYILMPGRVRIMLTKAAVIGAVLVGIPAIGLVAYGMLDKLVYSVQTSVATGADLERGTAGGRIYGWNQLLLHRSQDPSEDDAEKEHRRDENEMRRRHVGEVQRRGAPSTRRRMSTMSRSTFPSRRQIDHR